MQLGKPYYCDPTGADAKPYVLLRDSLEGAGKVAIVKVALRQRERLAMLRSREGVLVLQTLLWPDEVREPKFDFLDDDVTVRPQELQMAESYIAALSGDFEPEQYTDDYREALEEVIEAKIAGREVQGAGRSTPIGPGGRPDGGAAAQRRRGQEQARGVDCGLGPVSRLGVRDEEGRQEGPTSTAKKTASKAAKAPAKKAAAKKVAAGKAAKTAKAAKKTRRRRRAARTYGVTRRVPETRSPSTTLIVAS